MGPTAPLKRNRPGRRRIMLVGGLAAVLAIVAAIAIGRTDRDAATARRALADGRLDRASAALDRWLKSSPRSAEAHYLKARIAWARHDLGTVHQELERARTLGYPPGLMARLTGLFLARTHQTAEAEPLLRRAFDEGRQPDPEVAEALARIYLGSFRLHEAGAVLDRWAREVPRDARPDLLRTEVAEPRDSTRAAPEGYAILVPFVSDPFPGALHSMCTWARLKIGSILWALLGMAGSLLAADQVFAVSVR
jgi:tetratricopeptide (TPR) repeat protein